VSDARVDPLRRHSPAIIAVGASAGALDALSVLLPPLPASLPVPIVVVVHLPPGRDNGLAPLLASQCQLQVCEAEDKMPLAGGAVYFAPPGYHLLVERHGAAALSVDPPEHFSRPSIDVLFDSVIQAFGSRALGVLLSGGNDDGAAGLAAMRRRGALTWVQTPESARMPAMPEAALALAPHQILTPSEMADVLSAWAASDD
jgi:two-component system chemotaxis response regulator CheB